MCSTTHPPTSNVAVPMGGVGTRHIQTNSRSKELSRTVVISTGRCPACECDFDYDLICEHFLGSKLQRSDDCLDRIITHNFSTWVEIVRNVKVEKYWALHGKFMQKQHMYQRSLVKIEYLWARVRTGALYQTTKSFLFQFFIGRDLDCWGGKIFLSKLLLRWYDDLFKSNEKL